MSTERRQKCACFIFHLVSAPRTSETKPWNNSDEGDKQQIQVGLTASKTVCMRDAVQSCSACWSYVDLANKASMMSLDSCWWTSPMPVAGIAETGRPTYRSYTAQTWNRTDQAITQQTCSQILFNQQYRPFLDQELISYRYSSFLYFFFFIFLLLERSHKKVKAPSFQIGSRWNSVWIVRSRIFDAMSQFQVDWVGRNTGSIFRPLWAKVHQFCTGVITVCNAAFWSTISCSNLDSGDIRGHIAKFSEIAKFRCFWAAKCFGEMDHWTPKFLTQFYTL